MEAYELRFHRESECWRVYSGTELLYPLHCGDAMLFQVGDYFIPSNLELDTGVCQDSCRDFQNKVSRSG